MLDRKVCSVEQKTLCEDHIAAVKKVLQMQSASGGESRMREIFSYEKDRGGQPWEQVCKTTM